MIRVTKVMGDLRQRVVLATQKVADAALQGQVDRSPVLSGRFKFNWRVGLGTPDDTFDTSYPDEPNSYPDQAVSRERSKILGVNSLRQSVFVTNAAPYGEFLENGGSRKAPTGMTVVTAAEIRMRLPTVVR